MLVSTKSNDSAFALQGHRGVGEAHSHYTATKVYTRSTNCQVASFSADER